MNAASAKIATQSEVIDSAATASWPEANGICDLVAVAREAIRMSPRLYFQSIFGTPGSFLPPHRRFSEYNIIDPWRPVTTLRYLSDLSVPALPVTTPPLARTFLPPIVNRRFWRPTTFMRQPDEYGSVSTFPDEHWFFINGVATNRDLAAFNAKYLSHLFHRPVSVVQNATRSLAFDLLECALGKGHRPLSGSGGRRFPTEPAWRATAAILQALNSDNSERVVVIAHSQGTIIMANVLRAVAKALRSKEVGQKRPRWHPFTEELMGVSLEPETHNLLRNNLANSFSGFGKGGQERALERLAKLEIYTFANCADKMRYVYPALQIPYMEHFANEHDLLARLGVLSPLRRGDNALIEIDGPLFEQPGAWGHFLNQHYLTAIDDYLYPGGRRHRREEDPYPRKGRGPSRPRLYDYFHGKRPAKRRPSRSLRSAA